MPSDKQDIIGSEDGGNVIQSKLGEVLADQDKSLYWLQQQTGIAYTTLFRLRHNQASSVSFEVMDKICRALECQPGDLFVFAERDTRPATEKSTAVKRAKLRGSKSQAKATGRTQAPALAAGV